MPSIRPYDLADALPQHEAAIESLREMYPWMPWCTPEHTVDHSRTWIQTQIEARARGEVYEFAIVDGSTYLGGCGLNQIDTATQRANLGYWVRTSAMGRGVTPEAVRQLAEFAFRETNLVRLEIVIAVGNVRSERVAEKIGAHREGVLRSRLILYGKVYDAVMYSLVRGDWPPRVAE
jgi:ribosomal-protein-serine acetyltransferase